MNSDILLTVCFHATYLSFGQYIFIFKGLFDLNSEQVDGKTIVSTLGRAGRWSNVSDHVYTSHQQGLKCSCLTDKHCCKHLEIAY